VLVPFLNSFYPQTALPDSATTSTEDLASPYSGGHSYDERVMYRRNRRSRKSSPPLSTSTPAYVPPIPNRSSAPSTFTQFTRTLSHSTRNISQSSHSTSARNSGSAVLSPWSSNHSDSPRGISPADFSAGGLTDDTSASSPSAFGEPMTPPTTPPQCDYASPVSAGGLNNFGPRRDGGSTWKKMRSSFGFRKKSGNLREEEMEGNYT